MKCIDGPSKCIFLIGNGSIQRQRFPITTFMKLTADSEAAAQTTIPSSSQLRELVKTLKLVKAWFVY